MINLWLALALIFYDTNQSDPTPERQTPIRQPSNPDYEAHRQAAIQMNALAGHIRSKTDARELTDAITKIFAEQLPPGWATDSVRDRVAHAEYEAVADPSRLISEQRIADVWNEYVREIGAPDETLVNAAEIHNMRDAAYAVGELMWMRGIQTIWTMPNIYAVGADGKVASGCRAVEALRVLYELDNRFENLRGARERLQKGVVASDSIKESRQESKQGQKTTARLQAMADTNPVRPAEYRYVREQGNDRLNQLLERLFDELFPA